tara:strand:- start:57 stop:239 length:183 start_codon:yes stop_codon:yes gene_type:complete
VIKFILKFFVKNKLKNLKRKIDNKYKEAMNYQRIGKLREYAQSLKDIETLEEQYDRLQNS